MHQLPRALNVEGHTERINIDCLSF